MTENGWMGIFHMSNQGAAQRQYLEREKKKKSEDEHSIIKSVIFKTVANSMLFLFVASCFSQIQSRPKGTSSLLSKDADWSGQILTGSEQNQREGFPDGCVRFRTWNLSNVAGFQH